jgi:hypothetical protein
LIDERRNHHELVEGTCHVKLWCHSISFGEFFDVLKTHLGH